MLKLPKAKPIELSELTSEIKQLVPSLEGLTDDSTMLEVRRLAGDFTLAETTLITQALDAHDALAIQQARLADQTELQTLRTQLATDTVQWDTLTTLQKFVVIRRMLRIVILERG